MKLRRLIFTMLVHYIMIKKGGRQGRVTLIRDKKRGRLRADPDLDLYICIYLGATEILTTLLCFLPYHPSLTMLCVLLTILSLL